MHSGEPGHRPAVVEPNDDPGWLGREPTIDEQEVVSWMKQRALPANILHVGVGTGYLSRQFGARVRQGITRDGAEARQAAEAGLKTLLCNKYDVASYSSRLGEDFDCIVDVNIRSYSCCDEHFGEYMNRMLDALSFSGLLITSKCGLGYLVPTSTDDLKRLCPQWRIRAYGNVVTMRPRLKSRLGKVRAFRIMQRRAGGARPR